MGILAPFSTTTQVPILGSPFSFVQWHPTVLITCGCEAKTPILLVGRSVGPCAACGRAFAVKQLTYDGLTGQSNVEIGIVANRPQGEHHG